MKMFGRVRGCKRDASLISLNFGCPIKLNVKDKV